MRDSPSRTARDGVSHRPFSLAPVFPIHRNRLRERDIPGRARVLPILSPQVPNLEEPTHSPDKSKYVDMKFPFAFCFSGSIPKTLIGNATSC
jgi:hypothetical protein